mmetsp:Transcript_18635/g.57297  ORF Transcript_18635/g.57297 Transcript_18635/m.57297 type:complete len:85 (-) Transcript_18635:254-508(-)
MLADGSQDDFAVASNAVVGKLERRTGQTAEMRDGHCRQDEVAFRTEAACPRTSCFEEWKPEWKHTAEGNSPASEGRISIPTRDF